MVAGTWADRTESFVLTVSGLIFVALFDCRTFAVEVVGSLESVVVVVVVASDVDAFLDVSN